MAARSPRIGRGKGKRVQRDFTCTDCGTTFLAARSDALRCPRCRDLAKVRTYERRNLGACNDCNAPVVRRGARCQKCAARVRPSNQAGELNSNWKGGRTLHRDGYSMVVDPRPGARRRYVLEHRFLWEQANGPIPTGHVVHHLNGDKSDNRLENLTILTQSAHRRMHEDVDGERSKYIQSLEGRIRDLEAQLAERIPTGFPRCGAAGDEGKQTRCQT